MVRRADSSLKVDFITSAEMHRTVVNRGVDEELDIMKQTYDGIEDLLNRTSQTIAATVPLQYSLDLNVIFFPQIGFLISMPVNPRTGKGNYQGGDTEEQRWDFIFSTGSRVYYKDFRMRELDDTLGDMYAVICGKFGDRYRILILILWLGLQIKRLRSYMISVKEYYILRTL